MPPVLVDADPPIRVAVLASESDARLAGLLADGRRGEAFEIVAGFANVAGSRAARRLKDAGVPTEVRDLEAFLADRDARLSDRPARRAFDAATAELLTDHDPDVVALCGYLHVVTDPLLDRFGPAVVSVHHADLTLRDEEGTPRYKGLRSVREAIRAGEKETRETSHVVTEEVDEGPVIARSRPFAVHEDLVAAARRRGDEDVLKAYAYAHREWMMRQAGGPLLATTLELLADGRVELDGDRIRIDGVPGFLQVGEGVVEG